MGKFLVTGMDLTSHSFDSNKQKWVEARSKIEAIELFRAFYNSYYFDRIYAETQEEVVRREAEEEKERRIREENEKIIKKHHEELEEEKRKVKELTLKTAEDLFNKNNFEEAKENYEKACHEKKAKLCANYLEYFKAIELLKNDDYQNGFEILIDLKKNGFEPNLTKIGANYLTIDEIIYQRAILLMDKKEWLEAKKLFDLINYKDSKDKLNNCIKTFNKIKNLHMTLQLIITFLPLVVFIISLIVLISNKNQIEIRSNFDNWLTAWGVTLFTYIIFIIVILKKRISFWEYNSQKTKISTISFFVFTILLSIFTVVSSAKLEKNYDPTLFPTISITAKDTSVKYSTYVSTLTFTLKNNGDIEINQINGLMEFYNGAQYIGSCNVHFEGTYMPGEIYTGTIDITENNSNGLFGTYYIDLGINLSISEMAYKGNSVIQTYSGIERVIKKSFVIGNVEIDDDAVLNEDKYNKAMDYYNKQDYESAYYVFAQIIDYEDAHAYTKICLDKIFECAETLAKEGKYSESKNKLISIGFNDHILTEACDEAINGIFAPIIDYFKFNTFSIPNGITSLKRYAVCGSSFLETLILPDSIAELNYGCITENEKLKTINFGKGIQNIASEAVSDNPMLNVIDLSTCENLFLIQDNAFFNNPITNVIIPLGVQYIYLKAFFSTIEEEGHILFLGTREQWEQIDKESPIFYYNLEWTNKIYYTVECTDAYGEMIYNTTYWSLETNWITK